MTDRQTYWIWQAGSRSSLLILYQIGLYGIWGAWGSNHAKIWFKNNNKLVPRSAVAFISMFWKYETALSQTFQTTPTTHLFGKVRFKWIYLMTRLITLRSKPDYVEFVLKYSTRTLKTVINAQLCILLTKQHLYKFTSKITSKGP